MATRPRIGVTCALEEVTYDGFTEPAAMVPVAYLHAIERAGGLALPLVPSHDDAEDPSELLAIVDAVLLTGGAGDVDPAHYVASPHAATAPVVPVRDRFELVLAQAAIAADLPVLGVCRGFQVLNVACGGDLTQHLPDTVGHDGHVGADGQCSIHPVRLAEGSLAARAVGGTTEHVRSYHHQGAARLGDRLVASGWSAHPDDGHEIVEAIEDPGRRFCLGVLWHPEEDERSAVIGSFVAAAVGAARSA